MPFMRFLFHSFAAYSQSQLKGKQEVFGVGVLLSGSEARKGAAMWPLNMERNNWITENLTRGKSL